MNLFQNNATINPVAVHPGRLVSRRKLLVCVLGSGALAACGGGGGSSGADEVGGEMAPESPPPDGLTITKFSSGSSRIAGQGSVQATSIVSAGALVESTVDAANDTHRIFYDADGRAQAIRMADGNTLHLSYPRSGRVDVVLADTAGVVQWGVALYERDGQLRVAPLGSSLGSNQINATLSGPITGALTVNADPADPDAGIDTARAGTLDASLVELLTAGAGTSTPQAFALRASALATPGQQIVGGIVQAGVLAPLLVNVGLNFGVIVGGAAAGGLLATAGGILLVGAGAYALASGLSDIRNGAVRALMSESLDALGDDDATQASVLDRLFSAVESMAETGSAGAERSLDTTERTPAAGETTPLARGLASLPAVSGALGNIATQVRGVLVDTTGRLFSGAGRLDADGALALGLDAADGTQMTLSAQRNGTDVTGTYTSGATTGAVEGRSALIGQCNTSSSSGGAGTYSYAYNVGNGTGAFPFSYEMYSIPDQARIVDITGQELFNTGGLVSGGDSLTVLLAGQSNVVVLINAPNSGTRWDFTIGCAP
jgi:YD repeat-containing protein